jgi:virginiamycin B lyase
MGRRARIIHRIDLFIVIGLAALGAGCGDSTVTVGVPQTPTAPPTATLAVTPTSTSTTTPTLTPTPTETATPSDLQLSGTIADAQGAPLGGVSITAADAALHRSVSVFSAADGSFHFPSLPPAAYQLQAKRIGYATGTQDLAAQRGPATATFALSTVADIADQLPASYYLSAIHWPSQHVKGDFVRTCANCHQIGTFEFRESRSAAEWETVINRMISYGAVPFFQETRELLLPTLISTFADNAPLPRFTPPPAPRGDAVRAVVREWEIDPVDKPGCHDLEIGNDGTVYTVPGMYALNPATMERASYPIHDGGHSVEHDADGNMWITAPGAEQLIKFDVRAKQYTYYDQPTINGHTGAYPHTLRFDAQGRIWYTLTKSNDVCRFDPPTAQFTYYPLPPADPAISGVPIAVAYGCDVAPDQTVWWSQLYGFRIGSVNPNTGEVKSWRPPFDGPRRLGVGPDNIVWVPGYGSSQLGRFDPRDESWTVYDLPTQPKGNDLPYNVTVNRSTGDVWITGSDSDTLIRFRPGTEEFTVFHIPTPVDFTREIEFDDQGGVWTCTSGAPVDLEQEEAGEGTGRIVKVELRDREGVCGDGILQLGEDCDDGNTVSCDGCSADCRLETGCGDGVRCGNEACDDGNTDSCDGCSATCTIEVGVKCGDGAVNATCGEECDPPGAACTSECKRIPSCGDGIKDPNEDCDDGNTADCDGCTHDCRSETGCGDGVRCGNEACDDGNLQACDGCSPTCQIEPGTVCGDGIVNTACGEECDPPGNGCSFTCTHHSQPLGTRHFSFGGAFYSSALGSNTPLGTLHGAIDLVAGTPDDQGVAPLSVTGPVYYSAGILGGQFGTFCVRVDSCTGFVDCDGGTPVEVQVTQDSKGPGLNGGPVQITTGLGADGGPGAVELRCQQAINQIPASANGDCVNASYPAPIEVVYTTGKTQAGFINGAPKIGTGSIMQHGENFSCVAWKTEDGPGQLAGAYLFEEIEEVGDDAQVNVLDD